MSFLGELGTQVLGAVIDYQTARFTQPQIQPVNYMAPTIQPASTFLSDGFMNLFEDAPVTGTTATEVIIDNATGQCIGVKKKKKRRRRRRLATTSDIKDIAALKSVLGGGKALDSWIATRGR